MTRRYEFKVFIIYLSASHRPCATGQGIFFKLEGIDNPFKDTPLHTLIKPVSNQPILLAIFHEATGGQQDQLLNLGSARSTLTFLRFIMRQAESALEDAKQLLPEIQERLTTWIQYTRNTSMLLNNARRHSSSRAPNKNTKKLLQLAKQIDSQLRLVRSFSIVLKNRLTLQASDMQASMLILELDDIIMGLPTSFRLNPTGKEITQQLHGFSISMFGTVCIEKVCLDAINITVDDFVEEHCSAKRDPAVALYLKGVATKSTPLGFGLTLPKENLLFTTIQRESKSVTAFIEAEVHILRLRQLVNVTIDSDEISFKTEGLLFGRHMASLSVQAKTDTPNLAGLVYHVTGKLSNPSPLSILLEDGIDRIIKFMAEKSQKKIQEIIEALDAGRERREEAEKLFLEKKHALVKARETFKSKEKIMKTNTLEYLVAKEVFNASLPFFIRQPSGICEFRKCNFQPVTMCVQKVCQEPLPSSHMESICEESTATVSVPEFHNETVTKHYTVPKWTESRDMSCTNILEDIGGFFVGCRDVRTMKEEPPEKKTYQTEKVTMREKKESVVKFTCSSKKVTIHNVSFSQPKACCEEDTVDVLDPDCVSYNEYCAANITEVERSMQAENATLVESFQKMRQLGERASIAALEHNGARLTLEFATRQYELAKARFDQHRYAEGSINVTTVRARESLGLMLGEKIRKHAPKKLVKVQNLYFEADLFSADQAILPFTISVLKDDGEEKNINSRIDFDQLQSSVHDATDEVVRHLYGDGGRKRRRRSTDFLEEYDESHERFNENFQSSCLFAQDANLFFTEIVNSLIATMQSRTTLESKMEEGRRVVKHIQPANSPLFSSDTSHQGTPPRPQSESMRSAFEDIVQLLKQEQMPSNVPSWEESLGDWRSFLETFTAKKNFSGCSGAHDCINVFLDELWELYRDEGDIEALEIKSNLSSLQDRMSNLIRSNFSRAETTNLTSEVLSLLNKTKDDNILCGNAPEIRSLSEEITVLIGGTFNLSCEAVSKTRVEYLWRKNGEVIETKSGSTITFNNISFEETGAYSCEATNNRGKAVSNITIVRVHSRPSITAEPQDSTTKDTSEERAFFVCNATGTPEPNFQWYFIPEGGDPERGIPLNVSDEVLVKRNVSSSDSGQYYCRASNIHGQVESRKARLYVLDYSPATPTVSVKFNLTSESPANSSQPTQGNNIENEDVVVFDSHLMNKTMKLVARHLHLSDRDRMKQIHFISGPEAQLSFIIESSLDSSTDKEEDLFNEFANSRLKLGKRVRSLYQALEDAELSIPWKGDLNVTGEANTLQARFSRPECPDGQEVDQNGFLCGESIKHLPHKRQRCPSFFPSLFCFTLATV